MGIEIIVWELIGLPMLSWVFKIMLAKPTIKLDKIRIEKYKKSYLEKVNLEILQKYGDEGFYNKLSKCLETKTAKDLIERTFQRNINDFRLDDEMLEEILDSEDLGVYDHIEVRGILKHILETLFVVYNTPETETERKLSNITMQGSDRVIDELWKGQKELASKIDQMSNTVKIDHSQNNIPKAAINIINDKSYQLVALSTSKDNPFKVEFYVEYNDEMKNFKSMQDYQNYLDFGGEKRTFKLIKLIAYNPSNEILWEYNSKQSDCPMIKLVPILVGSVPLSLPKEFDDTDQCFLEFTPPQRNILLDIENSMGDKILSNLNYRVLRKLIDKNKIELTFKDTSSYSKIRVDFSITISGKKIIDTKMSAFGMVNDDVHSRLALYAFIKKLLDSGSVLFRECIGNSIILKTSGIEYSESKENLENTIEFYKKIITIQDAMTVVFKLPNKIYREDEKIVNQLFDVLTKGYTIESNVGFNLKDTEKMITDFDKLVETKIEVLFECNIKYMYVFDQKIEFGRDFFYLVPRALINSNTETDYSLVPQAKVIMIYVPVYHDYVIKDVLEKHKLELGL